MSDGRTLQYHIDWIKKRYPSVYKQFFTKRFNHVDNYHDYRFSWYLSAALVIQIMQNDYKVSDFSENAALGMSFLQIRLAMKYNNPLFFVSKSVVEASMNTRLPALDISKVHLPFDSFSFVFEKGCGLEFQGEEVPYMQVARLKQGKVVVDDFEISLSRAHTVFGTTTPKANVGVANVIKGSGINIETLNGEGSQYTDLISGKERPSEEEKKFHRKITHLGLSLLMIMSARPEIIQRERVEKKARRTKQVYYSPNFVGKKYSVRYRTHNEPHPTGVKQAYHWKSGHLRTRGIGKVLNLHMCDCGHKEKQHSKPVFPESLEHAETQPCHMIGCVCRDFHQQLWEYEDYKTVWIEPFPVNAT